MAASPPASDVGDSCCPNISSESAAANVICGSYTCTPRLPDRLAAYIAVSARSRSSRGQQRLAGLGDRQSDAGPHGQLVAGDHERLVEGLHHPIGHQVGGLWATRHDEAELVTAGAGDGIAGPDRVQQTVGDTR